MELNIKNESTEEVEILSPSKFENIDKIEKSKELQEDVTNIDSTNAQSTTANDGNEEDKNNS